MTAVLARHDPGCKWGRATSDLKVDERGRILAGGIHPGHTDAARRFADTVNLHLAAGVRAGWIAVRLSDGGSDGTVYDTRRDAVAGSWPWERERFYCHLGAGSSMSVCAAESLLRWRRVMNQVEGPLTDRDAPGGGLEVIPRVTLAGMEGQIRAVRTGRGTLPLGRRKHR